MEKQTTLITKTEILLDDLCFPEGLRWHKRRLWFSDMNDFKVLAVDLAGQVETILETRDFPSGLGWLPDGRLLVVYMHDRRLMRLDADGLVELADLTHLATYHCNDMVVNERGEAYVGNFGFDLNGAPFQPAELVLVNPEGQARVVADNLAFPNGTVITPDGKTLIVAETYGSRLTAFNIEVDGSLSQRRIWAEIAGVAPDGICLDAEGGVWVASPIGAEVVRVVEGGKITHRVKVSTQAYACMLGGENRQTLFIATSGSGTRSGCIEMVPVDIPGVGFP